MFDKCLAFVRTDDADLEARLDEANRTGDNATASRFHFLHLIANDTKSGVHPVFHSTSVGDR